MTAEDVIIITLTVLYVLILVFAIAVVRQGRDD